jgi:hypothetical protein
MTIQRMDNVLIVRRRRHRGRHRPPAHPRRRTRRRAGAVRGHLSALLRPRPRGHHRRTGRTDQLKAGGYKSVACDLHAAARANTKSSTGGQRGTIGQATGGPPIGGKRVERLRLVAKVDDSVRQRQGLPLGRVCRCHRQAAFWAVSPSCSVTPDDRPRRPRDHLLGARNGSGPRLPRVRSCRAAPEGGPR